jgi:hypothetical protein
VAENGRTAKTRRESASATTSQALLDFVEAAACGETSGNAQQFDFAELAPNRADWIVKHANRYLASGGIEWQILACGNYLSLLM